MIETIGSRNLRWLQHKRDDFLTRHPSTGLKLLPKGALNSGRSSSGTNTSMPSNIMENGRLQHAISSLSSSSGSSSDDTSDNVGKNEKNKLKKKNKMDRGSSSSGGTDVKNSADPSDKTKSKKVSCSSSSNDTRKKFSTSTTTLLDNSQSNANDFHDYHAPSLPDPLESGESSPESDSPHDGDSDHCVVTSSKKMCTDSSSDDKEGEIGANESKANSLPGVAAGPMTTQNPSKLPPNIAKAGGISHNVTAAAMPPAASLPNGLPQLCRAPVTALPPFQGLGKKSHSSQHSTSASQSSDFMQKSSSYLPHMPIDPANDTQRHPGLNSNHPTSNNNSNIITVENDTTSSQSSTAKTRSIQAYYHINEDDMCMTDDVLMCPFTFRSLDAVWCGALAECVMPGMIRVCFSKNHKLKSVEMIFDAMGFCQQLEHASGNLGMAQIIPNCLEMVRLFYWMLYQH